jgi:5-methyltetrahydrofolate--homocysteine methyltransferase
MIRELRRVAPLKLQYKPDAAEAQDRMRAFWAGEMIDRPCVSIKAPKAGKTQPSLPQIIAPDFDFEAGVGRFEEWASCTFFGGEAFPSLWPTYGPDVFSAFIGAEMSLSPETDTSWVTPFVQDWDALEPFSIDPENKWWKATLELSRVAAKMGEGKFIAAHIDCHSNMDCLSAIRGAAELCMDLIIQPDEVLRAVKWADAPYKPVYDAVFEAGAMGEHGSTSWLDMWSDGRAQVTQCDFCYMVSPSHFNQFVLPSLEIEISSLDHAMYHLDGPGELPHLDSLLAIENLHGIQWVPGAGQAPITEWVDVLKKIQSAGKAVHVGVTIDQLKALHPQLIPEKTFYQVWDRTSESEADELLDWLVAHT